jgi:signal transduction histidine kinase
MRWFRLVSLRLQIILLVVSFTLAVGLGNAFRAHLALDDLAREQFERRSVATALALAAQSTDLLLTNDLFGLYELLNSTLANTPDVRYIMVLDANGSVRVHTFAEGLPRGLIQINTVPPNDPWHTQWFNTEEGLIVDVAAPLLEGQAGTLRLGMSEQAIKAAADRHTLHLLGLMALSLLPVLAVTYFLGQMLTRPLLKLVEVTTAIRLGDLTRRAPVEGRDEVAQLSESFNAMAEALVQSQTALKTSNQTLQERNQDLATLYTIATATGHIDAVDSLVDAALTKSLEAMNLTVGWVFLTDDPTQNDLTLRVARGLSAQAARGLANHFTSGRLPGYPADLTEAVIVQQSQPCSCLEKNGGETEIACHAVIPLRSRIYLWGTMHLACAEAACFTPAHLNLLTVIGQQIGLAVENVHLAQTQRREETRRLLLNQVLAAQEEERKRIARELHDELAQGLTVLIRDLEHGAGPAAGGDVSLQTHVRNTRALALRILEQTRRLIFDLRPSALDDLGLVPALRRYARRHLDIAGIELQVDVSGQKRRLPPHVETALFRIGQEAVTNVVKHAQASRVRLTLYFDPAYVALAVTDNGNGFEPKAVMRGSRNIGLLGMQERAALLGGRLEINSRPGAGTSVQVNIPLEEL